MAAHQFLFTVVGYADVDDGVETFTEVVYATRDDAWIVAVAAADAEAKRDFLRQATEIATFTGVCVEAYASDAPSITHASGEHLDPNPDPDRLYDLQVFRRIHKDADDKDVTTFHWFEDDFADGTIHGPFDTYPDALRDRYEFISD